MRYLFLGDSITEGFNTKLFLSDYDIDNLGVSGHSTVETIELLENTKLKGDYDKVFICIGTNDLARNRSIEEIIKNINYIVKFIYNYLTNTKVFVHSIFPTRANLPRPNKKIIELNEILKSQSKNYNYIFLDNYSEFIDSAGHLKDEYTEDGLHLTNLAYQKWAELIKKYLD